MNFTQYVAIGCMYLILDTRILKYTFATKAIKWEIKTFNCRSGTLLSSTLPLPFSFFNLYEIFKIHEGYLVQFSLYAGRCTQHMQ